MTESTTRSRLDRAERKVRALEAMVEDKTRELFHALQDSRQYADFMTDVSNAMPASLIVFDANGKIVHANGQAEQLLGYEAQTLAGKQLSRCFAAGEMPSILGGNSYALDKESAQPIHVETNCVSRSGEEIPTLVSATPLGAKEGRDSQKGSDCLTVCILNDLRQQHQRESELRQTQKLETLGRLAAGIAHEINTPAQYVNDSLEFISDALNDIQKLIEGYREAGDNPVSYSASGLRQLESDLDIDYLLENTPDAIARAISGLHRISGICRSIKEFSHPSGVTKTREDINRRIHETLEIGRNEYKYVADVETDLSDLPLVECYGDEISQVILNMVVNAAHAIGEKFGDTARQGVIQISSALEQNEVRISISDNGKGIPQALKTRVFDAFFTTKPAGHGSGQGLALARSTIEARHGGRIQVDSKEGEGTRFDIYLPLELTALELV